MAYNYHGPVEVLYRLLQDIFGLHVEVVGRLVENQQIHRLEQQANHSQARFLTARKHLHLLVGSLAAEHEGAEDVAYFRAYVTHGNPVDGIENGYFAIEQLGLVLGEISYLDIMPQTQHA